MLVLGDLGGRGRHAGEFACSAACWTRGGEGVQMMCLSLTCSKGACATAGGLNGLCCCRVGLGRSSAASCCKSTK